MPFLFCAAILAMSRQPIPDPVLWLRPNGTITIEDKIVKPSFTEGTRKVQTSNGWGYDFDGKRAGILFGDVPALKITDEITISLWINLRSYVNDGPGAQILFRGDDRNGHDPYYMAIHGNGCVYFGIQNENDQGKGVDAEIPLNRWVHILANYKGQTGRLNMYLDGTLMSMTTTSLRSFRDLDQNAAPGVSVGNVQNNRGPHNQPINGTIQDLRLYRAALTPEDLGMMPSQPVIPPKTQTKG